MYSVTAEYVSLVFHSFIKIGKYLWIFYMHYFVCFKMKKKKEKRNSTPTFSYKNYINDCLKYFPLGINYKECLKSFCFILSYTLHFLSAWLSSISAAGQLERENKR